MKTIITKKVQNWLQSNGISRGVILFLLITVILVAGLIGSSIYSSIQNNYTLNEEEVIIILPNSIVIVPEVTLYNAAYDLEAQGIMDADVFQYKFERATGLKIHTRTVKGGQYTIPPKTHYKELFEILGVNINK